MGNSPPDMERIARLETKLDTMLESIRELKATLTSSYVPRAELEQRFSNIEHRIERLEASPQRWFSNAVSLISVGIALLAYFTK